jgi:hypothetical protein
MNGSADTSIIVASAQFEARPQSLDHLSFDHDQDFRHTDDLSAVARFTQDDAIARTESESLTRPPASAANALASPQSQRTYYSSTEDRSSAVPPQDERRPSTRPSEPFNVPIAQLTPSTEQEDHLDMVLPDGQARFYGPTSQRYLKDDEFNGSDLPEPRSMAIANDLKLDAAPRKEFLFQIFFRAQLLSTAVVNQASFEAGRSLRSRTQRYSKFLENAILASASRMSTSQDLRLSGSHYADRAKHELLEEMANPNMASLQGLLLLSDFEATRGRNRLGYIYCGIACRMVFDLGLTANCTTLVAEGKMSISDSFERHDLLLAAHVYDKLWSVYMGRPGAIPTAMVANAHQRLLVAGWKGRPTVEHWIGLCTDISDATELLLTTSRFRRDTIDRLRALEERLKRRFDELPRDLTVDNLDRVFELPSSTFALNIQFHGAQILFRGILKKANQGVRSDSVSSTRPVIQQQETGTMDQPADDMLGNAIAIARLVSTYHDTFGVENVVTVMLDNMYVASAVLVSHVLHNQDSDQQDFDGSPRHWLYSLRNILLLAQTHYPVATRMCLTLSKTVQGTVLHGMYDDGQTKVASSERNNGGGVGVHQLTSMTDASIFQGHTPRLDGPAYTFDDDPMLGNIFAEQLSIEPEGNLMDWLALGLETGSNTMYQS